MQPQDIALAIGALVTGWTPLSEVRSAVSVPRHLEGHQSPQRSLGELAAALAGMVSASEARGPAASPT